MCNNNHLNKQLRKKIPEIFTGNEISEFICMLLKSVLGTLLRMMGRGGEGM